MNVPPCRCRIRPDAAEGELTEQADRITVEHVEALRLAIGARAAGFWHVRGDRLLLVSFAPAPDMPEEVAHRFRENAREVGLDRLELGIVNAVIARSPAVSVAGRLPVETGSGYWLRAFGAERSVAVPIFDFDGAIVAVLSAALPTLGPPPDDRIVAAIRAHGPP